MISSMQDKVLNFLAKTDIKLKKLKTFQTIVIHEMEQCDAASRIIFFIGFLSCFMMVKVTLT